MDLTQAAGRIYWEFRKSGLKNAAETYEIELNRLGTSSRGENGNRKKDEISVRVQGGGCSSVRTKIWMRDWNIDIYSRDLMG